MRALVAHGLEACEVLHSRLGLDYDVCAPRCIASYLGMNTGTKQLHPEVSEVRGPSVPTRTQAMQKLERAR